MSYQTYSIPSGTTYLDELLCDIPFCGKLKVTSFGNKIRAAIYSDDGDKVVSIRDIASIIPSECFYSSDWGRFCDYMHVNGLPVVVTPLKKINKTEILVLHGSPPIRVWIKE